MRLRGLGLGRVGMEKLKNSHKGGCCAKILHKGMCCANFAQANVLCEFRTSKCVVRISHKALFTRPNANFCGAFK